MCAEGQGDTAKALAIKLGITTGSEFNAKMHGLKAVARSILPAPMWVKHGGINWCTVFAHICEMFRVFAKWPGRELNVIASVPPRLVMGAASHALQHLHGSVKYSKECHTEMVVSATMGAAGRAGARPCTRIRSKRPAGGSDPAEHRRHKGKRKSKKGAKNPLKAQSMCPRCKCTVRLDVMARHQQTTKCRRLNRVA